jgi:hypothetical protein
MFTLFDLLKWCVALGLMISGALIGHAEFGWFGAIGGGVLGFVGGGILGRIPWLISWGWYRLHLKRSTTDKLKAELAERYFVSHLLIAELVVRGEPVEQFWPYILSLVKSDSSDRRHFGWHNLNIWFPRLAAQVHGFDPHALTEACREKLKAVEEAEPDAAPLPSEGAPSEGR